MNLEIQLIWPVVLSFAISAILGPVIIPFLRKLKMKQTERTLGVESHLKKAGTPTMGGLIFLAAVLVTGLVFAPRFPKIVPVLILTVGFGLIGFLDDYLKVVLHREDGLIAWQKFLLQLFFTAIFTVYLRFFTDVDLLIRIPFTGGRMADIGWGGVPLLFFVVIGTVNGTNFTDGLDGLCSTVTVVVSLFFVAASMLLDAGVTPMAGAFLGALMGFLLYNAYPAKVFMGDTGSLALGGFVAGMAYMMNMPVYLAIIGFIYVVEVLSVIIQVSYFKATHGKRIFKMAPIHHHFELCGWSETRIVAVFAIITAVLCLVAMVRL